MSNVTNERFYNVYLILGKSRTHVARVESSWGAEKYIENLFAGGDLSDGVEFEVEVEIVITVTQPLRRYLQDGTVLTAK